MPKRTFDLADAESGEPVVFELAYKRQGKRGEMVAEVTEFACLTFMPPAAMRFLAVENNALASLGFIERCIASDADAARFMAMVSDRKITIREETLSDILEWLSEVYTGHPTESPAPSGRGRITTGESFEDD